MPTQLNAFFATAIIVFGMSGPIAADPLELAIEHFNASADNASERRAYVPESGQNVTVSAQRGSPIEQAITQLNGSADTAAEMIGARGATVFDGTPAHGADIFEQLRRQDDN